MSYVAILGSGHMHKTTLFTPHNVIHVNTLTSVEMTRLVAWCLTLFYSCSAESNLSGCGCECLGAL